MKKTVLLLFCALSAFTVFSGCGSNENSEIVGEWVPASAVINGESVQYSELEVDQNDFALRFESDGKCTVTLAGITNEGSYTFSDTAVDIKANENEYKLDYENGTLTLALDYSNNAASFTFTKSKEK